MAGFNTFLFVVFPYIAASVFLVGCIYRYRATAYKYSSLSSQFLETKNLFWGSVPFHWGILCLLLGHLIAFLLPQSVLAWNSVPARLLVLEVAGFAFGLSVLWGMGVLYFRRATSERLRAVSSRMDMLLEVVILLQVVLGLWVALNFRWGSSWFASTLSPYLWSLFQFKPNAEAVSGMPWAIQAHIFGAFLILFMVPFTRLVHFLVAPFHYIGRPYQRVMWYWDRRAIRDPKTEWSKHRPSN